MNTNVEKSNHDACEVKLAGFLNVKEVAVYLNVSPLTIYDWVHSRRIPFRRHGRRLAFDVKEITEWSSRNRVDERENSSFSEVKSNDKFANTGALCSGICSLTIQPLKEIRHKSKEK